MMSRVSVLMFTMAAILFVSTDAQHTFWQGTRSVLNQDGSVDMVRQLVRSQLVDDNVLFWNYTVNVDGACTELAEHVIIKTNGTFVWQGRLVGGPSTGAVIKATMRQLGDDSGIFGGGTFSAPGFVVNFGVQWYPRHNDYLTLTFADSQTAEMTGVSIDDLLETDERTYNILLSSIAPCK
jgi:hypothetical protein